MRLQFLLLAVLISTYISSELFAQTSDERIKRIEASFPVIDDLFKKYAQQNHFPAIVYGLIVDGKLLHTGSMGHSNLRDDIPADSKSEFRIASMTKSFTAMAILKLRDEKMLRLDDPVYLYIPEMKNQKYLTDDAPVITIRHLLTHSAGFPEDNPWGDRQLAVPDEKLLAMIMNGISFSNDPGLKFEYSNLGFAMLGYIIKKVSGQSYETYITQNILEPLDMRHTYWEFSKIKATELAHGYRWLNGQWEEQPLLHNGAFGAMGGLITSIEDFSKYVSLQLSAWPPRNDEEKGPIKRSSLREMQYPWNISYIDPKFQYPDGRICSMVSAYGFGLGWTKDCEGRITIAHGGGLPGFGSQWRIMPDYNIGIVSFVNLTYANTGYINLQVLDTLIVLARLQPVPIKVSPILNQRKNEIISILPEWKNLEDKNIFAENFFMDYFKDSLQKEALGIFRRAGRIIHIQELIPQNNLRGSFIIEGENEDISVSFTLTPESPPLIQEYHIKELKKKAIH